MLALLAEAGDVGGDSWDVYDGVEEREAEGEDGGMARTVMGRKKKVPI